MRIYSRFALGVLAALLPFGASFAIGSLDLSNESTAGVNLSFSGSGFSAGNEILASVIRPTGDSIGFSLLADDFGQIESEIYGKHLRKTGLYTLEIAGQTADFTIAPAVASGLASKVLISPETQVADGKTPLTLRITAKDAYGNLVSGVSVRIKSNSRQLRVMPAPKTDNYGQSSAQVRAFKPGVYPLEITIDGVEVLAEVAPRFTIKPDAENPSGSPDLTLGGLLQAQLFGDDLAKPDVAYFQLEGLAPEIVEDEAQNVTVSARDANGELVPDYLGTIRFSTQDSEASLPQDYEFTPEDQGEHTFFLGVNFGTSGEQMLSANDLDDFRIFGQWEGDVLPSSGSTSTSTGGGDDGEDNGNTGGEIELLMPKEGTYKSNRMTITGKCENVNTVRLTDNDATLTEGLVVDDQCTFVFQTPRLPDGLHRFQAISEQDESVKSNTLSIRIDRTPPAAMSVEIQPPNAVCPGQDFSVTLGSSEPLSAAECTFLETKTSHSPSGEKFVGNYAAPLEEGTYSLDCSIFDVTSNELDQPNAGIVTVSEDCGSGATSGATGGDGNVNGPETVVTPDPDADTDRDSDKNDDEWKDDNDNNIPDYLEGENPNRKDSDRDGLYDDEENLIGSNPNDSDTDDDCVTDGVEVLFNNENPLTAKQSAFCDEFKTALLLIPEGLDSADMNDQDLDGVPDWLEPGADKFNPLNDSDDDGITNADDPNPLRPAKDNAVADASCLLAQNFKAYPYEGFPNRAWLVWDAPKNCPITIKNYEINFGTDRQNLLMKNLTPDDRTKWYVDNLSCDERYYFKLNAKDTAGNFGPPAYADLIPCQKQMPVVLPRETPKTGLNSPLKSLFFGILTTLGLYLVLRPRKQITKL